MIKDISTVPIGQLWNGGGGASITEVVSTQPLFSAELQLQSPISCDLKLIRLKEGVSAVINNFHTSASFQCSRCLGAFSLPIAVEEFDRLFLSSSAVRDFDPLEMFLINLKDLTIDLTEAFRQEIILHFPLIPVCSDRCQGLCQSCKVNLNNQQHLPNCNYQEQLAATEDMQTHKPLAQLKDLFKQ